MRRRDRAAAAIRRMRWRTLGIGMVIAFVLVTLVAEALSDNTLVSIFHGETK